jgi:C4-type Zn-finger protein
MPIIDLEKLTTKSPHGITCPGCGGELEHLKLKTVAGRMILIVSFGSIRIYNYKCKVCEKKFNLF